MREILFRGKRIDNGEWVEGSLLAWPDGSAEICYDNPENDDEFLKSIVYPETVGQYTGLTDKNGKKIFEGDIVRTYRNEETFYLMTVAWNEDSASFVLAPQKRFRYYESLMNSHIYLEVIGTIHDNTEFLEVPHE